MRCSIALAALALVPSLAAQGGSAPTPACALLSVAEVRTITGRKDYPDFVDGDAEGEGLGGGSSCQYGGGSMIPGPTPPLLSIVLIKGKHWTEGLRKSTPRSGCTRETVAGVGEDAFFQSCPPGGTKRGPPLYVKVGTDDLVIQIDVEPPATPASARATVIAIAKAAAAKRR